MASPYFSHFSSPKASDIDAVISEATDVCVLEQIAALNTAHLSDSALPADIDSRFCKLKSFPLAISGPRSPVNSSIQEKENVPDPAIAPRKSEEPKAKPEGFEDFDQGVTEDLESSYSISRRSPSPTRVVCCFGCSPRKMVQKRKGKSSDELFKDFSASSMKEQRRKLEKLLKDQEKASREVEKMVECMEVAVATMNAAALDELLDGDGDEEFNS
ncbi:hypothetical protein HPP92_022730 [Vanilla planifolia]|uniref:Uncharacterized protein n=2 Tax=Vanilla planifolia TaxID=51239 RepID=A0A835PRF6_VANPL|nr:hypothetical protein HPP92_022730 [Vanilla planifolia]